MFVVSMMSCNSSSPNREYDAWGVSTSAQVANQRDTMQTSIVMDYEDVVVV